MESPFQQLFTEGREKSPSGFNPCFYGIAVSTSISRTEYRRMDRVSILVFMESPFQLFVNRRYGYSLFVSILVFMESPFQRIYFDSLIDEYNGFNPCFYGIAVSTLQNGHGNHWTCLFQSLFLWNRRFNLRPLPGYNESCRVSILVFMESPFQQVKNLDFLN